MEIIITEVKQEAPLRRLRSYAVLALASLLRVDIRLSDKFRFGLTEQDDAVKS